ncbi:hypothetical protein GCM10023340_17200 [Nocardioides marinquilinus]|uniref:Uncharacterized protein n=1 Tax=Nocardioides marinquilinus TaxID=1210400 RepID=A0ABP9PIT0_9ACTN
MNPHAPRRPARRLAGLLAALAALTALVAPPSSGHSLQAAASPAARPAPGGWERYPAADFVSPRGDLCDFRLRSQVRFDQVYARTTETFANGDPRTQQFSGPLVVSLQNAATGRRLQRDLSGRAVAHYRRDGSFTYVISGPVAVGFHRGDGLPRGYYVLHGRHVVRFAADGRRTIVADHGTEENLCRSLRQR